MPVRADVRRPLSLRNVLPEAEFLGADDIALGACSSDARRVRPGTLFVLLPRNNGETPSSATRADDAQAAVAEAIARGCGGIVTEQRILGSLGLGVPVCHVPHAGEAFGRICHAIAGNPSRRLKVVGLAGEEDPTTTACLIASILTTADYKVGVLGDLGYFDGREVAHYSHVTPPPPLFARWLARMVDHQCTHAIVEVTRGALSRRWVSGAALDAVCMSSGGPVGRSDSDRGNACQRRLAASGALETLTPEGFAVVNADDPTASRYLRLHDGPVLTVGIESEAEIRAAFLERCASEQTILLSAGSDAIPVRTRMVGLRHAYRCLTAAAVGLAYGIDLPTVVRGLEAIDYVPGRLERIECGQPFGVFIDRARTPGALRTCLRTLREVATGRLICVIGARGERDHGKRPRLGRAVERGADLVVVTDNDPHGEDPQSIIEDILSGLERPAEAEVIPDRGEAIGWALSQARSGDCVLIAGRGHRTRQVIGSRRSRFDDREVARQWLYANACDHE